MSQTGLILIGGGVRTGKTWFAQQWALEHAQGQTPVYIATAQAGDDEMAQRIARHQAERAGVFCTLEAPLAVGEALAHAGPVVPVVVDCLTLWLSNLLLAEQAVPDILAHVEALAQQAAARRGPTLLVTNEVGMGLVPDNPLGRAFRDVAGLAHQQLAAQAGEVYFGALGLMLRLKPAPIMVVGGGRCGARKAGGVAPCTPIGG